MAAVLLVRSSDTSKDHWRLLTLERTAGLNRLRWTAQSFVFGMALSLIVAVALSACDDNPQSAATPQPAVTLAATSTATATPTRAATPAPVGIATVAEGKKLVNGNTAFAFDLYHALAFQAGNLFYSPYSISLALAMTYAGARGETERQMADTLGFNLARDRLHPAYNNLGLQLASRGADAKGQDGDGFRLNIANAVWGQDDYEFLEAYLDLLTDNYGSGVRLMDFKEASEESRIMINDWVADRTEDRIKDLLPQGSIDEFTRLVLTNAIYFNAAWQHPFNVRSTHPGPFFMLDGSTVNVPMMSQLEYLGYAKGDGYQAVELPYDGYEMSMTIILPDEGRFNEFEDSIDSKLVNQILEGIWPREVRLTMPKFEFRSQFGLVEPLAEIGMPDAFDDQMADFSGMDGASCPPMDDDPCLIISDVIHEAFVLVNEEGTEAAAATASIVYVETESIAPPPIEVTVDRPFIFLIRDRATNAIVFVGRVVQLDEAAQ